MSLVSSRIAKEWDSCTVFDDNFNLDLDSGCIDDGLMGSEISSFCLLLLSPAAAVIMPLSCLPFPLTLPISTSGSSNPLFQQVQILPVALALMR